MKRTDIVYLNEWLASKRSPPAPMRTAILLDARPRLPKRKGLIAQERMKQAELTRVHRKGRLTDEAVAELGLLLEAAAAERLRAARMGPVEHGNDRER